MWLDMTFRINGLQIIAALQAFERANIQTPIRIVLPRLSTEATYLNIFL